jgi:hypothetical protein
MTNHQDRKECRERLGFLILSYAVPSLPLWFEMDSRIFSSPLGSAQRGLIPAQVAGKME